MLFFTQLLLLFVYFNFFVFDWKKILTDRDRLQELEEKKMFSGVKENSLGGKLSQISGKIFSRSDTLFLSSCCLQRMTIMGEEKIFSWLGYFLKDQSSSSSWIRTNLNLVSNDVRWSWVDCQFVWVQHFVPDSAENMDWDIFINCLLCLCEGSKIKKCSGRFSEHEGWQVSWRAVIRCNKV